MTLIAITVQKSSEHEENGSLILSNLLWNHVTGSWNGALWFYVVLLHNQNNKLYYSINFAYIQHRGGWIYYRKTLPFFCDLFNLLCRNICSVLQLICFVKGTSVIIILLGLAQKHCCGCKTSLRISKSINMIHFHLCSKKAGFKITSEPKKVEKLIFGRNHFVSWQIRKKSLPGQQSCFSNSFKLMTSVSFLKYCNTLIVIHPHLEPEGTF